MLENQIIFHNIFSKMLLKDSNNNRNTIMMIIKE